MMDKTHGEHVSLTAAVIYIIFTIISFFVIYPLVYVVSAAFSPGNSIASLNIIPFADGFTAKPMFFHAFILPLRNLCSCHCLFCRFSHPL